MASLKLDQVTKIYPSGSVALNKASLELSDKEFIAVVGGEKSGKSTLLRVISGLEKVTEGTITVGRKNVTDLEPKDRDVAVIFQGNTLYPQISVFENMAFGLKMRKAPQNVIDQRVKSAAEVLGLTDVLYKKPKVLSAEQKQKVAFGRAIVREPKLYLFDDSLAGLDSELKENMKNVLINLQARMEGTFVYATKNVSDALSMASRIVVMHDGFIQQIDTPENLYDYPANAYVAFIIGSPSINFLNGAVIEKEENGLVAVYDGVKIALSQNIASRLGEEYVGTGKKVILGIRPEDVAVSEDGVSAKVVSVDKVGEGNYAECEVTGELSLNVPCGNVAKGDEVKLVVDPEHVYVFDGETRLNVLSRDEGYVNTGLKEVATLSYTEEEAIKASQRAPKEDKKKKR